MDIERMLSELREERERINDVIVSLERLAVGRGRRRGRPPAWLAAHVAAEGEEKPIRKRRSRSAPRKAAEAKSE
ncbi:MAG: hypothetical protein ACK5AZ_24735 [Bryobacteraceae bacterium]